ncbi:MAG: L-threonylcarbamoyladenylate synthase [Eubacteriales bacterium]
MYKTETINIKQDFEAGIEKAVALIKADEVVAFPTETVYGLGANAFSEEAVKKIFKAKGRPADNPLIVHVADIAQAETLGEINDKARTLMATFWPGPFTVVVKKKKGIPDIVTGGLDTIGLRMPKNPGILEIIKRSGCPIAGPSANISGSPSPTEAFHVETDMAGRIPLILDGGHTEYGLESTVCDLTGDTPLVLRPGAVTAEDIKEAAGMVEISSSVLLPLRENETAASPGMKYAHYAPSAQVFVVKGPKESTVAQIKKMYQQDIANGDKPLVLCYLSDKAFFEGMNVLTQGRDVNEVAKKLFRNLREADADGYTTVYFQAVPETGIGLAVMNRIIRAAGFKLILVK